jgi:adenylate cyclase
MLPGGGPIPLWKRLTGLSASPSDTVDEAAAKRLQLGMAWASLPVIAGVGGILAALRSEPAALVLPAAYVILTILMLGQVAVSGRHDPFRRLHPLLVMAAPTANHLYLGGFVGSGGMVAWAAIAVVASLLFMPRREAALWLAGWIGLVLLCLAAEPLYVEPIALSRGNVAAQFAVNAIGIATFLIVSMFDFVTRLEAEKARSEALLRNVLPDAIAHRLRHGPVVIADRYEAVTVVFVDIAGFTPLAGRLPPEEVVALLNELFTAFDGLAEAHGVEKIKTIGDAWLGVAGAPDTATDHALRGARFALAAQAAVDDLARARGLALGVRIGVHSGPVVAGVIGKKKFAYDLWGDTVNTASRMESHGAVGRIHVSAATAALLQGLPLEARGPVDVKGKGAMETYWLQAHPRAVEVSASRR